MICPTHNPRSRIKRKVSEEKLDDDTNTNNNNNNNNSNTNVEKLLKNVEDILVKNKEYIVKDSASFVDSVEKLVHNKRQKVVEAACQKLLSQCKKDIETLYKNHDHPIPECPVCKESIHFNGRKLGCNHPLCGPCGQKLSKLCCGSKLSIECPLCRAITHVKKVDRSYHEDNNNDELSDSDQDFEIRATYRNGVDLRNDLSQYLNVVPRANRIIYQED